MRPTISVIIPVFEQWDLLPTCLNALMAQDFPLDRFEVIVVNNGPRDHVSIEPFEPLNLKVVHETEPGSYAARNCGIRHAHANILAFTDADCVPVTGWLRAVYGTLDDPAVARVCGPVEDQLPPDLDPIIKEYQHVLRYDTRSWAEKGWSITGNMASRRKVFDDIGLFDHTLKSGGDRYWGMRAQEAGHPIRYNEAMEIGHKVRIGYDEIETRIRRIVHGNFDVFKRTNKRNGATRMYRRLKRRAWRPPLKYLFRGNLSTPLGLKDRIRYVGFRWRLQKAMYAAAKNFYAGGEGERR